MFVDQQPFRDTLFLADGFSKLLFNLLFHGKQSERGEVCHFQQEAELLLALGEVALEREGSEAGEGVEEGNVDVEEVSVVEVESCDFSVLKGGRLDSAMVRVLQAPVSAIFCELAVEQLNPCFAVDVLDHFLVLCHRVPVQPQHLQVQVLQF